MIQIHTNRDKKDELLHEYSLEATDFHITVYFSDNAIWSDHVRGKECVSLYDDGNDIEIKVQRRKITIDYGLAFEIYLLLQEKFRNVEIKQYILTER